MLGAYHEQRSRRVHCLARHCLAHLRGNVKTLKLTAIAALLSAFAAAQAPAAPSSDSGATLTSNPVYEKQCAKCHGKNAEGKKFLGGPSLVDEKATSATADDLKKIITDGKGHMPKYGGKLTSEEIDTLVQQIKAGKK